MRRVLAVVSLLAVAAALALVAAGVRAGERSDAYLVRAVFENAGFVIKGVDVKVAGVKVGVVDSLDVTPDNKAAIVLRIEEPAYRDFRADARCIVRPQSLIGEKFVECTPTRRRAVGTPPPPPLREIDSGPGEGQRLLPVTQTAKSVDLDLINNVMRLPYRQRFSVILNEFGTALAGRGEDLRDVIRRADPALREVDEVLEILGDQNETLTRLAEDSDEALAPLARERESVTGFIERSAEVAAATADRREDLEANFERLPRFLAELTPTMEQLGDLSDQAAPVFSDLRSRAPQINRVFTQLGPFSRAATPALRTLGEATEVGTPALEASRPIVREIGTFARAAKPVGATLADVLTSFRREDGIERLMDLIYFQVAAINGYDEFGHYLRARLLVNNCSNYTLEVLSGCEANFFPADDASASAARATPAATPEPEREEKPEPAPEAARELPRLPAAEAEPGPAAAGGAAAAEDGMLDYLFGREE